MLSDGFSANQVHEPHPTMPFFEGVVRWEECETMAVQKAWRELKADGGKRDGGRGHMAFPSGRCLQEH